jgi:DegV family protein with EDD domain
MSVTTGRLRPSRIAVVTDSTAYFPAGLAESAGIAIVPLQLDGAVFGDEGIDVSPADVASALERHRRVTTSRPSPARFVEAYQGIAAAGIVSVHLSGELSGTVDAARKAAGDVAVPVRVVDSGSAAMGLGFAALAAVRVAADGGDIDAVAAAAERVAAATTTLFSLDTLEHLRRGGRIGATRALVGTALSVKPILHVADGRIVPLERVRTPTRGVLRLAALARDAAGEDEVDVAVQHLHAQSRAERLVEELRAAPIRIRNLYVGEIGAVIGAHVGPGVVGVVVSPCT